MSAEGTEGAAPDIRIIGGSPTAEEVAAVTAVLHATMAELAAQQALLDTDVTTAWQRSQRQLRTPLLHQRGAWRGFSG